MRLPKVVWLGACLLAGVGLGGSAAEPPKPLPGEKFTPPAKGERQQDRLSVGDAAPDFTLPVPSGKGEVKLSSFQGKRPVVLIFGSCT